MQSKKRPYILLVAEIIYIKIYEIKKKNPDFSVIDSIDSFIGSETYKKISTGKFHDEIFMEFRKKKEKIPEETMKLLQIQKEIMIKQLIQFPELYYAKSHYPLEISQRAFNQLWRMCESYELWCKESNQNNLILLNITD
tara:strand:+ start:413 stop:829 length:417 start_codon:yes stop_codon:yes gene_type:complete